MPAAFFGHGNPMNALEVNRYTTAWRAFGAAVPRPRAILVVSAHWYINATAVTAMPRPRTIHDFYGFPHGAVRVQYPAPGLPELADRGQRRRAPHLGRRRRRQLGHRPRHLVGVVHAFPDAAIPVVQLSINANKPLDYHLELGAQARAATGARVLIVASGNVVHNLRGMDWKLTDDGYDWAQRFDEDAKIRMLTDPTEFATLDAHRDYGRAVPTPDHFIPALYLAGLAGATETPDTEVLVDGYAYGSLSMTAYTLGLSCPNAAGDGGSPSRRLICHRTVPTSDRRE